MLAHPYKHQLFRALALFSLAVALVANLPGRPADAQGTVVSQPLDDSQLDFTRGQFQRTSISADQNSVTTSPVDAKGAIQLAPIGTLKPWEKAAVELPTVSGTDSGTRSDAPVVTIGDRLFVIAGTGNNESRDTVLYATVDQVQGDIKPHGVPNTDPRFVDDRWLNVSLPQTVLVRSSAGNCTDSLRTRAAAASLTTGANSGFIYVVGGATAPFRSCGFAPVTISAVQIGRVEANGTIAWSDAAPLPSAPVGEIDFGPRGVEDAAATVVRTASGKAFLYVVGGLSTYNTSSESGISQIEKAVFRAEIDPSTGGLGAWVRDDDVPVKDTLSNGPVGIFDHVAVHVRSTLNTAGGSSVRDGLVVAGGYSDVNGTELNPLVYQASIDPASGDLTWAANASADNREVSLVQGGQAGMGAVSYNNKLYMIGGLPGATDTTSAVRWVQTAVYNDDLKILPLPGLPAYFVGGGDNNVLPEPRANFSAALMSALPPPTNPDQNIGTAWVFVVGGTDASGADSRFIYRGRIGGDEADTSVRTTDGWYYSRVFDVTFQQPGQDRKNAKVLSINWAAEVDRSANLQADMIVQFRRVLRSDPNCPDESVFRVDDPTNAWRELPKDATTGFYTQSSTAAKPYNTVTLQAAFGTDDFNATCFQYRVRFIQNGLTAEGVPQAGANPSLSPKLFSMNIEKIVVGNADIRIPENGFDANVNAAGRMTTFTTVIQNLSLEGAENTTNAATAAGEGSFYVHLCVTYAAPGAGTPPSALPTLPLPAGQKPECFKAFYEVYTWQMMAGRSLALNNYPKPDGNGTQTWMREENGQDVAIEDIRTLFSQPGTYRVAMVIDAWNYISEGALGEQNNLGQEAYHNNQPKELIFEIKGSPINRINLPIIRR